MLLVLFLLFGVMLSTYAMVCTGENVECGSPRSLPGQRVDGCHGDGRVSQSEEGATAVSYPARNQPKGRDTNTSL